MGGRIWAESESRKGSIIHFTIICEAQQNEGMILPDSCLKDRKMLLVESNESVRRMLMNAISSLGHDTREASSGGDALILLAKSILIL
jgi:hypothetical protein